MPYSRKTTSLCISNKLRELLESIQNNSEVASLLLKNRISKDDLIEDNVNYLSISESDPTKISYITADRIDRIEREYGPEIISRGHDMLWSTRKRFHAKPGAIVSKIFKDISPREIEIFSNLYKLEYTLFANKFPYKFEIVKGREIKDCYHHESYRIQDGSLGNSCMKHNSCQPFFNLYVDNSNIISLLILTDDNDLIVGRALLWNFIGDDNVNGSTGSEYKIMDRIYSINDEDFAFHFKRWADQNGYYYKHEQKWNNSVFFESNGKKLEMKLSFQLPIFDYQKYPYLDTFKFINRKNGYLYNYIPENKFEVHTMCAPDGSLYDCNFLEMDYITKLFYNQGEMVSLRYMDNIRVFNRSTNWSSVNDTFILSKECKYLDIIDDYIFIEEFNHLNRMDVIESRIKEFEERRIKREKEILKEQKRRGGSFEISSSLSEIYDMIMPTVRVSERVSDQQLQPREEPQETRPQQQGDQAIQEPDSQNIYTSGISWQDSLNYTFRSDVWQDSVSGSPLISMGRSRRSRRVSEDTATDLQVVNEVTLPDITITNPPNPIIESEGA